MRPRARCCGVAATSTSTTLRPDADRIIRCACVVAQLGECPHPANDTATATAARPRLTGLISRSMPGSTELRGVAVGRLDAVQRALRPRSRQANLRERVPQGLQCRAVQPCQLLRRLVELREQVRLGLDPE